MAAKNRVVPSRQMGWAVAQVRSSPLQGQVVGQEEGHLPPDVQRREAKAAGVYLRGQHVLQGVEPLVVVDKHKAPLPHWCAGRYRREALSSGGDKALGLHRLHGGEQLPEVLEEQVQQVQQAVLAPCLPYWERGAWKS